jgi:lipopolysaccharide export system permease protein
MKIFDWYIFRMLLVATAFIGLTLVLIIFLTQSLRFLELVMSSGASSASFWVLTFLALPRFFEIILPLALMAAALFTYNRMTMDSELIVVRGVGYAPFMLAKPALTMALCLTVFLWGMTMWAAPKSLSRMQEMSQLIKTQLSTYFFQEQVFNRVGNGLTVYLRERTADGELHGLLIHDSRTKAKNPSTIMAKRGVLVAEDEGYQVLVYDGSRHEYDREKKILNRLNFERYTIDLPDSGPVRKRWKEPDERTIYELLNPNPNVQRDLESKRDFTIEIHRRILSPLLSLVFTMISCTALLLGPADRRGQNMRIFLAIGSVVVIQGLYLAAFNIARQNDFGLALMYVLVFAPFVITGFMLSPLSEQFRRHFLYKNRPKEEGV